MDKQNVRVHAMECCLAIKSGETLATRCHVDDPGKRAAERSHTQKAVHWVVPSVKRGASRETVEWRAPGWGEGEWGDC